MKIAAFSSILIGIVSVLPALCAGASVSAITLEQLNKAVSSRASDSSCASVSTPSECAPNSRAVMAINHAIAKYGVTSTGEIAALIALMAYESADWQYNINHYPGRPGQGTKAMLMYDFIEKYAQQVHQSEATRVLISGGNSDSAKNSVRELVLNDDDSFGAVFWYLVTQAPAFHNNPAKLRAGNADDFKEYVVNGVNAGWDDKRMSIWNQVNSAFQG
ncbi:hypothetical protein J3B02_003145 [Coemansia erecta]|uniref:Uncharacterized protein n=1 Tax=Coemansia asiatica TaxID=1052880 RepID=A0A9W8CI88_9FUNG|nr:hypothetical protein LPJ64_004787 [Coemansia asiatica]KAJ2853430.1 hypothetical protein J3B02_003145 [Coemansia erecta]KAJ2883052.1 hypothetical protein FB639_002254 [Coemansia asiatica]